MSHLLTSSQLGPPWLGRIAGKWLKVAKPVLPPALWVFLGGPQPTPQTCSSFSGTAGHWPFHCICCMTPTPTRVLWWQYITGSLLPPDEHSTLSSKEMILNWIKKSCAIHSSKFVPYIPSPLPTLDPRHTSILLWRNLPAWLSGDGMSQLCWSPMDTVTVGNCCLPELLQASTPCHSPPNPGVHENPYQSMPVIL